MILQKIQDELQRVIIEKAVKLLRLYCLFEIKIFMKTRRGCPNYLGKAVYNKQNDNGDH